MSELIGGAGLSNKWRFYDLGCGGGKLVLGAAVCYDFAACIGVELFAPLVEAAHSLQSSWAKERWPKICAARKLLSHHDSRSRADPTHTHTHIVQGDCTDHKVLKSVGLDWAVGVATLVTMPWSIVLNASVNLQVAQ